MVKNIMLVVLGILVVITAGVAVFKEFGRREAVAETIQLQEQLKNSREAAEENSAEADGYQETLRTVFHILATKGYDGTWDGNTLQVKNVPGGMVVNLHTPVQDRWFAYGLQEIVVNPAAGTVDVPR